MGIMMVVLAWWFMAGEVMQGPYVDSGDCERARAITKNAQAGCWRSGTAPVVPVPPVKADRPPLAPYNLRVTPNVVR